MIHHETEASVEAKRATYRALVAKQRSLPLSEQHTMAGAIRAAKAAAIVAAEALRLGQ